MVNTPPSTGNAQLDSFLRSVADDLRTLAKPREGWRLSDFATDVSEVISDRRDLIDILADTDENIAGQYLDQAFDARTQAIEAIGTAKTQAMTEIDAGVVAAKSAADTRIAAMAPMVWLFHGTGTPVLTNYPSARVNDVIRRQSDGQEWRVDAGKLTLITNPVALRLDTTVGTRIFAGDTMIYGDTGWRVIIDPSNFPTMTQGRILAKRTAGGVMISMDAVKFSQAGSISLPRLVIPLRPKFRLRTNWYAGQAGGAGGTLNISSTGYFNLYAYALDQEIYMDATFDTDTAWPTSLPGIPA